MGIFWRPNGGRWQNGGPQGFGELYNSDQKTIKKGFFITGILNDPNGMLVHYPSNCSIFNGSFENDQKNGEFVVYVIAQPDWEQGLLQGVSQVAATKKTITYAADALVTEGSPQQVQITMNHSRDANNQCIIMFSFETP